MDNHLMIFESADFGRVRSVLKDGAPWFVAVDVCKALGLNQVTRAMSRLDSDEGGLLEVPHPQNADKTIEINAVSEAGLYHLILCSKKPEARAFKRWITHEVIPSIRKHGAYMTDSLLDALEAHPEAVPEYLNRLRSENARNRELTRRLRLALPKAEYYDAFVDPADCTNIRTTAKELGVPEKQFTRYLEEKKYLFRDKNRKLFPRAVKKSAGLFLVRDFYTECGELDADEFLADICDMVAALVRDAAPVDGAEVLFPSGRPVVGKCPRCGAEVTESKNGYFCERRSCKFGLWRDNRFLAAKKISLTKKMASSLLTQGRAYASGIYSEKTGKTYDAFIVLEDDGARSSYKLDFTK